LGAVWSRSHRRPISDGSRRVFRLRSVGGFGHPNGRASCTVGNAEGKQRLVVGQGTRSRGSLLSHGMRSVARLAVCHLNAAHRGPFGRLEACPRLAICIAVRVTFLGELDPGRLPHLWQIRRRCVASLGFPNEVQWKLPADAARLDTRRQRTGS
jgi:hypothetical protein